MKNTALVILAAFIGANALAADADYATQVKPILKERCYACHGSLRQNAGLRLDTGFLARKGSENGAVVSAESPDDSILLDRVSSADDEYRMPPIGKPLSREDIELLRDWIRSGATSPENEQPEADPRDHWAFRRPVRSTLPDISQVGWPRNAIDYFLHAQYDHRGIAPAPDASDAHLLRRIHLDLTGLPPTRNQLQAFLADPSETHYARIVDELLNSPQYGERWGRHWMDIWRYSDWYGRRQVNDVRNSAPQIWRWRDWIVDSLNNDKGYAQMVREMIAADEITPEDDSTWPATGYLIRNYYSLNPNEWMRHNVEYTGKAFLGLTFNCAHCHDHKYDPIAHEDYFRMRAFFEPLGIRQDRVTGQPEPPPFEPYTYAGSRAVVRDGMVRVFDEQPTADTWFYSGGDERNREKERGSISPGVPAFLDVPLFDFAPIDLPMSAWYPGSRPNIQQAVLEEHRTAVATARRRYEQSQHQQVDLGPFQAQLALAQQAFDDSLANAVGSGETGALAGKQSLYLDAHEGRRIVQHDTSVLKSIPEGTEISFQLCILQDSHVNFQLARDSAKGLTALYVGFAGGQIDCYRPGGFQEFTAGRYDISTGQNHFNVKLVIHPEQDVANLTVQLHGSETVLVNDLPIALNQWNPARHADQPFTFDCRPGTQALIDEITVLAGDQRLEWGFEEPPYSDAQDVDGIEGWTAHPLSAAPATSVVSMIAACESARDSYTVLQSAKSALRTATLAEEVARLDLEACRLRLEGVSATIAADNAKRNQQSDSVIDDLSRNAYRTQNAASTADARWRVLQAEYELGRVQVLPDENQEKSARVKEWSEKLAAARSDRKASLDRGATTPESIEYTLLSPTTSRQSTGRRMALAQWITDAGNPLTARVAVNHIWLRHFHAPLVESVYDFGRNGKQPTHPELLDWLAVEFMEHDWSMKHLHRLIVTSRAYRMSSSDRGLDDNLAKDRDNRWLWRMNRGRMEAEVVRDSALFIAAQLDRTLGGPVLPNTDALSTFRRSLYYEVYPEDGGSNELASIFDAPDPTECFRRTNTIVPQQGLALSNSEIIHACCTAAASRLEASNDDELITAAFAEVLSRHPSDRERDACHRFLNQQRPIIGDDNKLRESLIRVLFNHNDFVTIR